MESWRDIPTAWSMICAFSAAVPPPVSVLSSFISAVLAVWMSPPAMATVRLNMDASAAEMPMASVRSWIREPASTAPLIS